MQTHVDDKHGRPIWLCRPLLRNKFSFTRQNGPFLGSEPRFGEVFDSAPLLAPPLRKSWARLCSLEHVHTNQSFNFNLLSG